MHQFIFTPGKWVGTGQISFSMADDRLPFKMSWTISPEENGKIICSQTVEVENFQENMQNLFVFSEIKGNNFTIELENHLVGKVKGKGIADEKLIAWEFRSPLEGFEGFEIYELQPSGHYKMRAEFVGGDNYRTFIFGEIRQA